MASPSPGESPTEPAPVPTSPVLLVFLAVALVTGVVGLVATAITPPPVPVLLIHDVAPQRRDHDFWTLHPDRFAEIMDRLVTLGRVCLDPAAVRAMREGRLTPAQAARSVVITIDDGCVSSRDVVAPGLRARGLAGHFFLVSSWGPPTNLDGVGARALEAGGHFVGSHAATHESLLPVARRPKAQEELRILGELYASRKELAGWLGHAVDTIAYPRGDHDSTVTALAARVGYTLGYTTELGYLDVGTPAMEIPRFQLNFDTTADHVEGYVEGPARQRRWESSLWAVLVVLATLSLWSRRTTSPP